MPPQPKQKRLHQGTLPNQDGLDFIDKLYWEKLYWKNDLRLVAGLDEVGRGALAGPVVAACVVFDPGVEIPEIDDSKKLTPNQREELFGVITSQCRAYTWAQISSQEIDQINILEASLKAMREAVYKLPFVPEHLLVDGNRGIGLPIPQKLLVKGDSRSQSIGAASILAKVVRDRLMHDYQKEYPHFTFSIHKGYGTLAHQHELQAHGPTPLHRRSFEPVAKQVRLKDSTNVEGVLFQ